MDYLVTFEDGSSGYLAHHGIKGMKWGVWNAETKARRNGSSSKKVFRNQYEKQSYEDKKAGYDDGVKLRKQYGITQGPSDISKDYDKVDAAYKEAFEKNASSSKPHNAYDYGDGVLSGLMGEKNPAELYKKHLSERPDTLFVSGSSKTQFEDSGYYRKKLPREVRSELKKSMKKGDEIIVGDAPGVDRQVQDYLNKKRYGNVGVYGPDVVPRYKANKYWTYNDRYTPNSSGHEKGSKEWLADKDIFMTNRSSKGLAVILDNGANATRNNIKRLQSQGKETVTFMLSSEGKRKDRRVDF